MAKVSVLNVAVLENPSPFHSPFRFEISFECNEALTDGETGPAWSDPPPLGRPDPPLGDNPVKHPLSPKSDFP